MITAHKLTPSAAPDSNTAFRNALEAIKLHCDPEMGAPYWIETIRAKRIRIERDLHDWNDLLRFGWMDEEAMRSRSAFDFVPRTLLLAGEPLIPAETSGFLGRPKSTLYTPEDFDAAFIRPFMPAAALAGFPLDGLWLYLGPGGPHPIGRAANRLGRLHGRGEPFCVDFDPRWFNRLAAGSLARDRYMDHLLAQAMAILNREMVDVLFATPAVLERLALLMTKEQRERIRGVHYGGQPLGQERFRRLRDEFFTAAVHLGGYGNSLLGVCMEVKFPAVASPVYFPSGDRLRIQIAEASTANPDQPATEMKEVAIGERGRVIVNRFDRSMLILNMIERDEATRIETDAKAASIGCTCEGIAAPDLATPLAPRFAEGIY